MNENQLIKKLKRLGYNPIFENGPGKGSHGTLYIGNKKNILKDRKKEIGPGLLNHMLNALNVDKKHFK